MPQSFESALGNLLEALRLVADRYQDRRHEDGMPMISHLIDVLGILWHVAEVREQKVLLAALLYRVERDGVMTAAEIEQVMGGEVQRYVQPLQRPADLKPRPLQRLIPRQERHALEAARQISLAAAAARLQRARQEQRYRAEWAQEIIDESQDLAPLVPRLGRYLARLQASE